MYFDHGVNIIIYNLEKSSCLAEKKLMVFCFALGIQPLFPPNEEFGYLFSGKLPKKLGIQSPSENGNGRR